MQQTSRAFIQPTAARSKRAVGARSTPPTDSNNTGPGPRRLMMPAPCDMLGRGGHARHLKLPPDASRSSEDGPAPPLHPPGPLTVSGRLPGLSGSSPAASEAKHATNRAANCSALQPRVLVIMGLLLLRSA